MEQIQARTQRNQTMELFKLLAAVLVVFMHVPFPGELGGLLTCLGSVAVPYFFMVTGYFNYGAKSKDVERRMVHIICLLVIGRFIYALYDVLVVELNHGSTIAYLRTQLPDLRGVAAWLFNQLRLPPEVGHLWYLNAAILCYGVYWMYIRFVAEERNRYQGFYLLSLCLFPIFFAKGVVGEGYCDEIRNAWFFGIPFFGAGLFLHQYQERIVDAYNLNNQKLVAITAIGLVLTVIQWKGQGENMLPLGMLIALFPIFLLLLAHPRISTKSWVEKLSRKCGRMSAWIYIFHMAVRFFYEAFLCGWVCSKMGTAETFAKPIIVLSITLLWAFIWDCFANLWRRMRMRG